MSGPALVSLAIADPPERWRALGFAVTDSRLRVGGVWVLLGAPGAGIVGWSVSGVDGGAELDGLPWTDAVEVGAAGDAAPHPNGALGIDHVVVATPDFDRTAAALDAAGLGLRRVRDGGGFRQGFRRLGPAILELVEARGGGGPARFWGLVVIVPDLAAVGERLGERLGAVKDAVQPGRRIATLRESAGLSTKVAFMDSEP